MVSFGQQTHSHPTHLHHNRVSQFTYDAKIRRHPFLGKWQGKTASGLGSIWPLPDLWFTRCHVWHSTLRYPYAYIYIIFGCSGQVTADNDDGAHTFPMSRSNVGGGHSIKARSSEKSEKSFGFLSSFFSIVLPARLPKRISREKKSSSPRKVVAVSCCAGFQWNAQRFVSLQLHGSWQNWRKRKIQPDRCQIWIRDWGSCMEPDRVYVRFQCRCALNAIFPIESVGRRRVISQEGRASGFHPQLISIQCLKDVRLSFRLWRRI